MNIIDTTDALAALCARLSAVDFVTVDTEFMRETTFWPKLCLVQIASVEDAAIIDPLADGLTLDPLFELLVDERVVKVFHAARQDIEIFHHLSRAVPTPMFDTQVAAMVCGFGESIAYDQLVQRITGHTVDKSSRFTNWAERPLSRAQLDYALADVTHLRDVYVHIRDDLARKGREEWVQEEMAILGSPATYDLRPEDAWKRLKSRARQPVELAVLQEMAALREREARERDVPRNRVMKDDLIYEVALQRPQTPEALGRLRAASKGFERSKMGERTLRAVKEVLERAPTTLPALPRRKTSIEGASAAVELMKVLLKLCAEEHDVAPRMLATVDELEAIVAGRDAPALSGWRRAAFGELALKLKAGEIGIAFDGKGLRVIDCERPVNPVAASGKSRRRRRRGKADNPSQDTGVASADAARAVEDAGTAAGKDAGTGHDVPAHGAPTTGNSQDGPSPSDG